MATFTESDLRYLAAEYRTLDELCSGRAETPGQVRALIDGGRLPAPAYLPPDGVARYPPDYFALVDDAGSVDALPGRFRDRHLAASGSAAEADEDWSGYLSGQYGICLWEVTPEAMVRKTRLIARIEELVGRPAPEDRTWRADLRAAVVALDALERPFTDFDRERWGDTSRGRHITRVMAEFPAVFALSRA
jgi:hypothetical protein